MECGLAGGQRKKELVSLSEEGCGYRMKRHLIWNSYCLLRFHCRCKKSVLTLSDYGHHQDWGNTVK